MSELNPPPGHWPGSGRIVIAFSGGPDSLCLLHRVMHENNSRTVTCLHVDHGLDVHSGKRASQAHRLAAAAGVDCEIVAIKVAASGSPEAAARKARYRAIEDRLEPGDVVLTAHHADDQVETVLMRLLRGSGPAGLAGIPRCRPFGRGWLIRPLLDWRRRDILDSLDRLGLVAIDDPANDSLSFDRNYLRQQVMPVIHSRWPGADRAILRSAGLSSGAAQTLAQLAADDLARQSADHWKIRLEGTEDWPAYRIGDMLREWCHRNHLQAPPGRRIDSFIEQLHHSDEDRQPALDWNPAVMRKWRNHVWLERKPRPETGWECEWRQGTSIDLPEGIGTLEIIGTTAPPAPLRLSAGNPGDSLQPAGEHHHRNVRQLLAERGVPPWQRDDWPRIWLAGTLAGIADVWQSADLEALLNGAGARLKWHTPLYRG